MDPTENVNNYKFGIFYSNKDDWRIVVPRKNKALGWTLNFANKATYLFILAMLVAVLLVYFITKKYNLHS